MERHSQYFKLSDIRRVFPELFPIRQIGFMNMNAMPRYHLYAGKLEFCLRFSEKEEFSDDIVNNVKYRIPFPNVFLKTPDLLHGTRFKTDRQAVYFAYDPALYERMRQCGLLTPPFLWHFRMTPEISFVLKHIRELADRLGEYGIADRIDTLVLKLLQDTCRKHNMTVVVITHNTALTPMAVDPAHPFPLLRNKGIYVMLSIARAGVRRAAGVFRSVAEHNCRGRLRRARRARQTVPVPPGRAPLPCGRDASPCRGATRCI